MKTKWTEYLWIASMLYLFLGLFHILFAWLGLITAAGGSFCSDWVAGFPHSEPVRDG